MIVTIYQLIFEIESVSIMDFIGENVIFDGALYKSKLQREYKHKNLHDP